MRTIKACARFWYDLIIGDDWKIAAAVTSVLLAGAAAVISRAGGLAPLPPLLALGLGVSFTISILIDTRARRK